MKPNSFSRFHTRGAGNAGTRMPLVDPITFEVTEDWLDIVSVDSDLFRDADAKAMRKVAELASIEDEEERAALVKEAKLELMASLITGWSAKDDEGNPVPCTLENRVEFLRESPQTFDALNQAAVKRALFIKGSSPSFSDSPLPASNLTVVPQDQQ